MPLDQPLKASGDRLFRRRGWMILAFLPLLALGFPQEQVLERALGDRLEDFCELACLALVFGGLIARALTVGLAPAGTSRRNVRGQVARTLHLMRFRYRGRGEVVS